MPKWLPWLALVAAVIVVAVTYRAYGLADARAEASQKALVEARAEGRTLSDSLQSIQKQLTLAHAKVDTLWRKRDTAIKVANGFGKTADSLIVLAVDTGQVCHLVREAYDARTSECAALRKAVATDSLAIQEGQQTIQKMGLTVLSMRGTNDSLRNNQAFIQKASTCHYLPFIPCLSRTMTFLVGAAGGFFLARIK